MINAVMRKLAKACFGIQFLSIASLFHFPQRSSSSACFSAFFTSPLSVHRTGLLDLRPHPLIVLLAQCPSELSFLAADSSSECCPLISRDARSYLGNIPYLIGLLWSPSRGCIENAGMVPDLYESQSQSAHFPFTKTPPAISPATLSQPGLCFPCLKSSPSPIARLHFFLRYPRTSPL